MIIILCALSVFAASPSDAFQVRVQPSSVDPGDAFVVRLEEIDPSLNPTASFNGKKMVFSRCGESCLLSVAAVGVDTEAGIHPVSISIGSKITEVTLVIRRPDFPTIHLTLPSDKVFLSPEDQTRANREAAKLAALWNEESEKLWEGNFMIPLGNDISTVFGVKRIMNRKKVSIHRGVDIRGKSGEPVMAFNRGKIVIAEELFYGGNTIVADHGEGIFSIYMHLSELHASVGDIVAKGDVVGLVGSTGRATGPHLHFGVKVRAINANPLSFLKLNL